MSLKNVFRDRVEKILFEILLPAVKGPVFSHVEELTLNNHIMKDSVRECCRQGGLRIRGWQAWDFPV